MKKIFAVIVAVILTVSATAFAATYTDRDHDMTFEYDDTLFEIAADQETDDNICVVLQYKGGNETVSIDLEDLDDGVTFPGAKDIEELANKYQTTVEQFETWGNFKNVYSYTFADGEFTETVFIAPVYDDDGELEDKLTVNIRVTAMDEEAGMARDDAISAIVDTLKVIDD